MKNIVGWIIGIAIIWFIFFGFNSLVGSSTTPSGSSGTSSSNSYDSSDENIGSYEIEEDANINDNQPEFNGYPCTIDCSGHEAGFDWAEENGITQDDVDNYSGNSNSFMEGMQSYVDESY